MNNILIMLEDYQNQEINTIYQQIATWMLANLESVDSWKIVLIANAVKCSAGMVSKFAKVLKCQGFKHLIFEITHQTKIEGNYESKILEEDLELEPDFYNQTSKMIEQYFQILQKSLILTHKNNKNNFIKIASQIKQDKPVYLFGVGINLLVCEIFANYLLKLNYQVYWSNDVDGQIFFSKNIQPQSFIIFFSYSGVTKTIYKIFKNVKEANNNTILSITANVYSDLYKNADFQILVKNNEEPIHHLRSSRIQFIYIVMVFSIILRNFQIQKNFTHNDFF